MKKMILCAAALMIGGVAMAQSTDGIQTAANNSTNPTANAAEVTQGTDGDADYQKVRVVQIGATNSVVTNQDGTPVSPMNGGGTLLANSADVLQVGNDNAAEVDQNGIGNLGSISQAGLNGAAFPDGDGLVIEGNAAILNQNNDGTLGDEGNTGILVQGVSGVDDVAFGAEANEAVLTQDGSANKGRIVQLYDRNDAVVSQTGSGNISDVAQDSQADLSDGQEAAVTQSGADNVSVVDQAPNASIAGSDSGRSIATTNQTGNSNRAKQEQRSTAVQGQTGETATINQNADYAQAIQVQSGNSSVATINQSGKGTADAADYAKQRQTGGNHTATATQTRTDGHGSVGNFSFQDQSGWDNIATNVQDGFDNKAQSKQVGNNNKVDITQTGDNNAALTIQMGNESFASTTQSGGGNMAYAVQQNGQSANISQAGWGNEAAVFQSNADIQSGTMMTFGTRYQFDTPSIGLDMIPNLEMESAPYQD